MILTVRAPRHRAVRLTGVAGLSLALLTLGVPGIASAATPTCFGKRATIVGQVGVERIDGTAGADVIVGLAGRQIISGGEGLFPEELVHEFKQLRDRVPAEDFDDVRRVASALPYISGF